MVLQADWDPTFSDASYGFRLGRAAHQAVAPAQAYIADGYDWVVDLDLEKFFARVNHDILLVRGAAKVRAVVLWLALAHNMACSWQLGQA
jgi:RNA-directed DNA polymerase